MQNLHPYKRPINRYSNDLTIIQESQKRKFVRGPGQREVFTGDKFYPSDAETFTPTPNTTTVRVPLSTSDDIYSTGLYPSGSSVNLGAFQAGNGVEGGNSYRVDANNQGLFVRNPMRVMPLDMGEFSVYLQGHDAGGSGTSNYILDVGQNLVFRWESGSQELRLYPDLTNYASDYIGYPWTSAQWYSVAATWHKYKIQWNYQDQIFNITVDGTDSGARGGVSVIPFPGWTSLTPVSIFTDQDNANNVYHDCQFISFGPLISASSGSGSGSSAVDLTLDEAYDNSLIGNKTIIVDGGLTLGEGIRVRANNTTAVGNHADELSLPQDDAHYEVVATSIICDPDSLDVELVTNGDWAGGDADWTYDAIDWTYASNAMNKDADGVGALEQIILPVGTVVDSKVFLLEFTISNWTVGTVTPAFDSNGFAVSGDGTYRQLLTSQGGSLVFTPSNDARFTIDNVSLKQVIAGDLVVAGNVYAKDSDVYIQDIEGQAGILHKGLIVNEDSGDYDTRIESNTYDKMFVVDAGLDQVQVGTATAGAIATFGNGETVFNEDSQDRDFRVESNGITNAIFVDGGADEVTLGTPTTNIGDTDTAGTVRVWDGSGNNVDIKTPALASDWDLTVPPNAGAAGSRLISDGAGVTSWENHDLCRAFASGATTLTNADTFYAVALADETFDTGGWHSNVTNNSRITPGVAGAYFRVTANCSFTSIADRVEAITGIGVNGTAVSFVRYKQSSAGSANMNVMCSDLIYLANITDYIEILARSSAAGTATGAGTTVTYLIVERVR